MAGLGLPQYNVDEKTQQVLLEKAKRRLVLREEFLKLKSDPFKFASGEGGAVFDPALMRHQALKVYRANYFKPTAQSVKYGMLYFIIPLAATIYLVSTSRAELEDKYRRGEVAYRDRKFKFV